MTLARFLSRGKGGLPSLTTMIDRQVVVKAAKLFNQRAAFLALGKLKEALEQPYTAVSIAPLLKAAYDQVFLPKHRDQDNMHPSELMNSCPRMLYYRITHTPKSNPEESFDATSEKHFWVGHQWHEFIQELLLLQGTLVQAEVPIRNVRLHITGHADGILLFVMTTGPRKVILEIKTCNSFTYKSICKSGKPLEGHLYQAGIYAKELLIEEILFLYINKDTGEMKEILVAPKDYHEFQKDAYEKIHLVNGAAATGTVLPRVCKQPTDERALNCSYCNFCFGLK